MSQNRGTFGCLSDGREAQLCRIVSPAGEWAEISTYGACLVSFHTPDRDGNLADVVLGFDAAGDYETRSGCYGMSIGRFANRVAYGRFPLNGEMVQLDINRAPHTIHGGSVGFHKQIWDIVEQTENAVTMTLFSPDGDQGFPGNLTATARFALERPGVLSMTYTARCDKDTLCGFTNHAYFNLAGHDSGTIAEHRLQVEADHWLATDELGVPTGELPEVAGTAFDLRQPTRLGDVFELIGTEPEITRVRGYDHPYLLRGEGFRKAALAEEPSTGRRMEVWTDLPAVQVFTAGKRDVPLPGKKGASYGAHTGFCLETEQCPDAPNHPSFPSAILRAGEEKTCHTEYRFSVN